MTLAEKYPHLFCRRCDRLGSQCACGEASTQAERPAGDKARVDRPEHPAHIDGED